MIKYTAGISRKNSKIDKFYRHGSHRISFRVELAIIVIAIFYTF